jgi:hypothetical protein
MPSLTKATLQEISADKTAKPIPKTELEVQFNPQSLKLELANQIEGGDTRGRQNRQYLGHASTTLSFDLHFDSADLGTTNEPVSVREQTAMVERFVLPKGKGDDKQAPPKCRFHWNELIIDGIIESLSIDFELFAANGTPLRAKMSVALKEQNAKYELLEKKDRPAAKGRTDKSAQALAGESAADFAVRMGLDPGAWRGIAGQLGASGSLSLQAGVAIDFSSSLSLGAGIGIGISAGASAGFALSAAGGLSASLATAAGVKSASAAASARLSFGMEARASVQTRTPPADPRATTFGLGVPLRPRASVAVRLKVT